jgi:hypothetical protein
MVTVTPNIPPVQATTYVPDAMGCMNYNFYGSSYPMYTSNVVDCALEAATIMANNVGLLTSDTVVKEFVALAYAESSFYPSCVGPNGNGQCVFSFPSVGGWNPQHTHYYTPGTDASGLLQEGWASQPDTPVQLPYFNNNNGPSLCPGYGITWTSTNWEGVYFNPLCAFEWAYAYYQSHISGGGFQDWGSYGGSAYNHEINQLKSGPGALCRQFCTDSFLAAGITQPGRTLDLKFYGAGPASCAVHESCSFQIDDIDQLKVVDQSSCQHWSDGYFNENGIDAGDGIVGLVWIYLDYGCGTLLTEVNSSAIMAVGQRVTSQGNNACYVGTNEGFVSDYCGYGYEQCQPGWDDFLGTGMWAAGYCPNYW